MPQFLIDLTLCFAKGQNLAHGGGEFGKAAARFMAQRLEVHAVVGLVRSGHAEDARAELGDGLALREVGDNPLRELPADVDHEDNILFLPLAGQFLEASKGKTHARLVVVEHGFRYQERANGISDHLCHPLLAKGVARWLACGFGAYLRWKRLRHGWERVRRQFQGVKARDWVITPSRHTQYAFYLELDRIAPGRAEQFRGRVLKLPPLSPFLDAEEGEEEANRERQGILLLSANRPVKNAERLLVGIVRHRPSREAAKREGIDLVGVNGNDRRRLERLFGAELTLRFHPYVDSHRLQQFIRGAKVLAFPSLSEGYGIPPVEAFKWGTPVLASAVTAVPEVVGDAAMLADPLQPTELANRLLQLLDDEALWRSYSEAGKARYRQLREETLAAWEQFATHIDQPSSA